MDSQSIYFRQVQLLFRLFPIVSRERSFALKGGTAINLFVRDMPRLSVDLDLVYLPIEDRETSLRNIRPGLKRISEAIDSGVRGSKVTSSTATDSLRLLVEASGVGVKIELSPVLRGSVFQPKLRTVKPAVEDEFGYAEMLVLDEADLYAGKICAALDRQHPRDLFDIKLLFANEGLTERIRKAFIVYLISHNRPMAELLAPRRKDFRAEFEGDFRSMTNEAVTIEELEQTRERLVDRIRLGWTEEDKQFLMSFKERRPNWELLGIPHVETLPAVRWKLINLAKMTKKRHEEAVAALRAAIALAG